MQDDTQADRAEFVQLRVIRGKPKPAIVSHEYARINANECW